MFGNSSYITYSNNGHKFLRISSERDSQMPLVLLHGMFGGLSNFDPLIKRIRGYTIFVPQIPIFEMERDELTIPKLSLWLKDFCTSCNLRKPVLLGNSMGGHIALEYARAFPGELSALVLAGSSGLFENDFGTTCPKRNDREYIRQRAALTFYEDIVTEELIDEIMEVTQSANKLPKLLQIARSTHNYNMEDELPNITTPTLLVWGKEDLVTPPEVARQFKEKLPRARLRWIERCGHAPMMERPDEFVIYLKAFLNDLNRLTGNKNNSQDYEGNYSHG